MDLTPVYGKKLATTEARADRMMAVLREVYDGCVDERGAWVCEDPASLEALEDAIMEPDPPTGPKVGAPPKGGARREKEA